MTNEQRAFAINEIPAYSDADAFVSDLALSSAFLPEDEAAMPDDETIAELRRIWIAARAPFREFLGEIGLTQTQLSRRFCIPLRTVQSWALGERECPAYVRLMMEEITARDA